MFFSLKMYKRGFPGGTVVKNPPANAGDTASSPDRGRSHMPRSNYARAPQLLSPRATTTEARAPQQEKPPLTATRESLCAATKTQCSQK